MLLFMIRLSALSLGISCVASTTPQQQSQLATLHERMNQMISALYSSPLLSKAKASVSSTSEEYSPSSPAQDATFPANSFPTNSPHIVYISSSPNNLESGIPSAEYAYPLTTPPVPRPWHYPYEVQPDPYRYHPHYAPSFGSSYPLPRLPYLDYPRPVFPAPQSLIPSQYPYAHPITNPAYPPALPPVIPPYPAVNPSPYPTPLTCIPQVPFPSPLYPPQSTYPSSPMYPLLPYPSPVPSPYPSVPAQIPPTLPYRYPSYSLPFPKPADILPQPQYEYSS